MFNKKNLEVFAVFIAGLLISFCTLGIITNFIFHQTLSTLLFLGLILGVNIIFLVWYRRSITKDNEAFQKEKKDTDTQTEFIAFASHQLRSPLVFINFASEELLKKKKIPKDIQEILEQIHTRSKRLTELVNSLLNITSLNHANIMGAQKEIDIVILIKEVVDENRHDILSKKLVYKSRFDSTETKLSTDPKLLKLVISNIVENAVKYSHESGNLDITVLSDAKSLKLTVKDTGIGIPQNQKDQVFARLFRASNARVLIPEGNGLGLYIVKAIIDAMNGKVILNSQENKGTEVLVTLPFTQTEAKNPAKP